MAAIPSVTPAPWSQVISRDDHGALVSIATCLMLAGMLLFLIIRAAIRWPWKQLLGWDDAMTGVGSLLAVGQTIAIFRAVHYGLGRHEDDLSSSEFQSMEKAIYASDILFVFSLLASKLAVALLQLRLSSARNTILAAYALLGTIGAWGFASILAVAIRPDATTPWALDTKNASHVMDAFTGVGATSVLTEAGLLAFPVLLVWTLQMPLQSKLTVIAAFAFRLPVAIIAILRIVSYRGTLDDVTNTSWHHVVLAIYTEIEMHYSLIAATIPCMHVFLKNFNTGYLGTTADQVDITATMAATKGSNSYVMSTVRSRHTQNSDDPRGQQRSGTYGGKDIKLRPNDGVTTSRIVHKERSGDSNTDAGSVTSDGSDKIMVRRTVEVDYGRQGSQLEDSRWK